MKTRHGGIGNAKVVCWIAAQFIEARHQFERPGAIQPPQYKSNHKRAISKSIWQKGTLRTSRTKQEKCYNLATVGCLNLPENVNCARPREWLGAIHKGETVF